MRDRYESDSSKISADDEARKNWEKFGHPDGKQAMDLGIAIPLPTDGKNGPIILALLVFVGLILPMGLAAWFLFSSSKYMGPNQIMQETLNIFLRYTPSFPGISCIDKSSLPGPHAVAGTADQDTVYRL